MSFAKKLPDRDDDTEETDLDTIPLFACISVVWHSDIRRRDGTPPAAQPVVRIYRLGVTNPFMMNRLFRGPGSILGTCRRTVH
ncbi:hypothetical protein B5K08_11815 [Rhizobium leguminosarum bv. trifolii]|uniref:Uncharacterized protein n=1 Tax=Rhizobium leguminosarum bv. trifolii TaxID=386 RepID=A0A3E1BMA5_RHILT|nr:hypothetical protein B5K08_11815 [Rhizobium leguminosarum bv. trifolii]RFB94413.1 hypothetical protein B5K10_11800 [Rhizobium leguminosarum bv. trifolii]